MTHVRWEHDGWQGWIDPTAAVDVDACLTRAAATAGTTVPSRRNRPARHALGEDVPGPGGWRALRAFRMGTALGDVGFAAPAVVLAAVRGDEGLLVTRDTGGEGLLEALGRHATARRAKRPLLAALGAEVARLHRAGFVHGDLVPANVRLVGERFVFLDNDRTRRSRLLVLFTARRNLVQLGRFVVAGLTVADRAACSRRTRGAGPVAPHAPAARALARPEDDRAALRDRPHRDRDGGAGRVP
jgi:hypothetical protein